MNLGGGLLFGLYLDFSSLEIQLDTYFLTNFDSSGLLLFVILVDC